eukprot:15804-Heterococcus_DN1.PRE.4
MEAEWKDPAPMLLRWVALAEWCLFVAFQILLTLRMDRRISISWAAVFAPWFVWEGAQLAKGLMQSCRHINVAEDQSCAPRQYTKDSAGDTTSAAVRQTDHMELVGSVLACIPLLSCAAAWLLHGLHDANALRMHCILLQATALRAELAEVDADAMNEEQAAK